MAYLIEKEKTTTLQLKRANVKLGPIVFIVYNCWPIGTKIQL